MAWPVLRNSERFNLESLFWINKKSTQKEHLKIFWVEKSSKVDFSLANKIMECFSFTAHKLTKISKGILEIWTISQVLWTIKFQIMFEI